MAVVKINAIEVPEGAGPELEKRFANRLHAVDGQPGFLSFELLRPVKGEDRYFVVTHWDSEESFQAWLNGPAMTAHSGERARPVASGSSLLEFEVVQRSVAGPERPARPRRRPAPVRGRAARVRRGRAWASTPGCRTTAGRRVSGGPTRRTGRSACGSRSWPTPFTSPTTRRWPGASTATGSRSTGAPCRTRASRCCCGWARERPTLRVHLERRRAVPARRVRPGARRRGARLDPPPAVPRRLRAAGVACRRRGRRRRPDDDARRARRCRPAPAAAPWPGRTS